MVFYPDLSSLYQYRGRIVLLLIMLGYAGLYILNILMPLDLCFPFQFSNLTSRIWSWTELILGIVALYILVINRETVSRDEFCIGIILGLISGTSHYLMNQSLTDGFLTAILVMICYSSALLLIRSGTGRTIITFQESPQTIGRLILLGIIISIPFAILNLAYFYLNTGLQPFTGVIYAGILACNPAISEEIIFRLFPVILVITLLRHECSERTALGAAVCIGVIPHSLNHLPDLLITNPVAAMSIWILTSLLFGLPLCLIQLYKGLPSACGFHWFVDMTRFLFGY